MNNPRDIRNDLGGLPRVEDSWSFLYVEHRQIHQASFGLSVVSEKGTTQVPVSQMNVLLMGPGVSITHAAIRTLADHGCTAAWVGESSVRFYASGCPDTNKATNLHKQVRAWADPIQNRQVVRRLYVNRYGDDFPESHDVAVLRGHEGKRVKDAYVKCAQGLGLRWEGRRWTKGQWDVTSKMNRALSVASSCMYGICHAAIVAVGFHPALGFIHTGDMRSFVLDVADMYREKITIPVAFSAVPHCSLDQIDTTVRHACRDAFHKDRLIEHIVPDIYEVLGLERIGTRYIDIDAWEALSPGKRG